MSKIIIETTVSTEDGVVLHRSSTVQEASPAPVAPQQWWPSSPEVTYTGGIGTSGTQTSGGGFTSLTVTSAALPMHTTSATTSDEASSDDAPSPKKPTLTKNGKRMGRPPKKVGSAPAKKAPTKKAAPKAAPAELDVDGEKRPRVKKAVKKAASAS